MTAGSDKVGGSSHLVDFRGNQGPGQEEDEGAAQGEERQRAYEFSQAAAAATACGTSSRWRRWHSKQSIMHN